MSNVNIISLVGEYYTYSMSNFKKYLYYTEVNYIVPKEVFKNKFNISECVTNIVYKSHREMFFTSDSLIFYKQV